MFGIVKFVKLKIFSFTGNDLLFKFKITPQEVHGGFTYMLPWQYCSVGMILRMRWGQYTHTPVAVDHMLLTLYNHLLTVSKHVNTIYIIQHHLIAALIYCISTNIGEELNLAN